MSAVAIRVEGLGKRYKIGGPAEPYGSLRESLSRMVTNPLRRLRRPAPETEDNTLWALRDVSFEVTHGEVIGVVGRNGAGKSTLLKLLSRVTEPSQGRVDLYGHVGSLLEVGTGFHPELTGRENIYLNGAILGMSHADVKKRFDEIVAFAEVERFIDTPVKRYSSGMYLRLAFAVAAHLEPDILVVDEVLAVGDLAFQEKCLGKMEDVSDSGRTVLFVSHNMDSIRKLCKSAIHLDKGTLVDRGAVDAVINSYLAGIRRQTRSGAVSFEEDGTTSDFYVSRVEPLDKHGRLLEAVHTWDYVCFRISFHCPHAFLGGAVVLQVATLSGTVLTYCSTQPDQTMKLDFHLGENVIDCIFPKLILAAGTYRIGAGLAIPNVEMLYDGLDIGLLRVEPTDVFGSGLAPRAPRYLIPQEHGWQAVEPLHDTVVSPR